MRTQLVSKWKKEERKAMNEALSYIDEKNDEGQFTERAKSYQSTYHSSVSILKNLKRLKKVKHIDQYLGGLAQLARALDLHSRGQGFGSLILHMDL